MSCISPFYVNNPAFPHASQERQVPVPCGKCPPCLKRRVSQWSFRLLHELRCHDSAHFITLTYDNEHSDLLVTRNRFLSLNKVDFQVFMKRLRKKACNSIKYYMCGEYGSKNFRPHYHAIIFGADRISIQYTWDKGFAHVGFVSEKSIAYVLKYINKGKIVPVHGRDDRLPEFALMSKGLGKSFISDAMKAYYAMNPLKCYCTLPGGYIVSMPRYYKDKIFDEYDKVRQAVDQRARLKEIEAAAKDVYLKEYGTLDGFYRMQDERRLQCVLNFKKALISRGF